MVLEFNLVLQLLDHRFAVWWIDRGLVSKVQSGCNEQHAMPRHVGNAVYYVAKYFTFHLFMLF